MATISFDDLHRFTCETLRATGVDETDAATVADVLVTTDAWGVFTHGTKLLAGYLRRLEAGGLRAQGRPCIEAEGGAWARIDGDSALGHVASVFGMRTAIAKAKAQGSAYVGVRNTCHFGGAGYYAWLAAKEGLIGLAMSNDLPTVAAPGSRGSVLGSNPIAYAVPAGKHPPVLLDMSTAAVAGGKVYAARMRGEAIPPTWMIGADGKPTTDPSGFPQVGALQPAAGHKGYGIALLIETLSGILTGAAVTHGVGNWMWDDGTQPTKHGAAFLAIDVKSLMPEAEFAKRMEALVDEIHAAPLADGATAIRMPGEMEWERHEKSLREGIPLPSDVVEKLQEASAKTGVSLPF
jgi:LDH2 family malate/lactate/ureidoglycolate dehydrogenase